MKKIFFAFLLISIFACDKEEISISDLAELVDFKLDATSGFTPERIIIDSVENQIHVFINNKFEETNFPISLTPEILVSQGASVAPASGTAITFNHPEDFINYTIISEDSKHVKEYIFTIRDTQIPNSDFENWFTETGMNGQPFEQPGKYLESTVWATANMGTSIYSIYGTSPMVAGDNTLIKIETVPTIALPLVAGALYLGKFDVDGAIADPTNPVAAAKLGIPFISRPKAVQFKYSFKSGDQLIQAELKDPGNLFGGFNVFELEGKDMFGIKAVLEKRFGDTVTTIAETTFESDQDTETLTEHKLTFQYFSNEEPTHFYISFSPSFDGGTFKGAVGSTLIIDDIELLYE